MPQRKHAGGSPALAQALEEAARAEARAEAARAHATDLNRKAAQPVAPRRVRVLRRPGRKSLAVAAAVVLICTALGTSGYVVWYHRKSVNERQHAAQFVAAARQGALTLMSIDAGKARDDVQRIIDDSTGSFKTQMMITAEDLVKSVEESKVSTKAAVMALAVESMTDDSAVVLVSAKAETVDPDKTKPPWSWRIVMTLQRDAGQIKVSKVELLP